ncbi:hypothetical protein G7B40_026465 [Aetokthonos hydrillicola Thurmond2011]|jgi:hypothetical protein|uniref:Uncharacterized protein n=1 Tax=Aetokthonos hydrillicola Thurmond2011 TaxID=2712845 RepID=A0AAP5IE92_9CYAN|nr:hypothetical protein [Aetokthonos hydrillicola]MBO3461471.1 hypothetical protein [Aetokthonos hydrillicola CCALA 1050]MBW4584890.1 hypothetical protein [Aetokthonos hydrillicola CCALA 1050]MDR9898078.1 hypothetical protein [Aetokthonos hydrillicola Thurmond2011]
MLALSVFRQQIRVITGVAAIAVSVIFASPALSAPTEDLVGGSTSVSLSSDFVNALASLNVQSGLVTGSKIRNGAIAFPISGGAVDLGSTKLEVLHKGGLTLTAGSTHVALTDFVITNLNGNLVLTGIVISDGNLVGRIPLFNLGLPANAISNSSTRLQVRNVELTLTEDAATALNGAFSISAFKAGFPIGTAQVHAVVDHPE